MNNIDQLKQNIKTLAATEGKTELEIVNELLAGAAKLGHEENVEILLDIRQPMIQAAIDKVYGS